jgi:hypothetical protein
MHESQNTESPGLRFRAVMTEGRTQMNFYSERFDRLGEVSAKRRGSPPRAPARWTPATSLYATPPHGPQGPFRVV